MRMLDRKLLRDLRQIWVQCLAIALVLGCGIMVLILATGTQRSLEATRAAYYEQNRFADVFATLTRAPRSLLAEIARLDGVARVEGRVVFTAMIDLEGKPEPAAAIVISVPPSGEPVLNVPVVRLGRMPRPDHLEEVAVSEAFAEANGLRPGDSFRAVLNGQMRPLRVVGLVISPEYIYTVGSGAIEPDDENFGILWLSERAAASAKDLSGAFNDLTLTLARGADERAVIAGVDRLLAPYGGTGAYGRDRQPSNVFIEGELKQLGAMATVLPPIFLAVSAVLVNMVLGRLVALDRGQIGLFKAVGYKTRAISAHYTKMTVGIGLVGILLGWAFGWWLGHGLTEIYTRYFRFPSLLYRPGAAPMAISGLLGMAAAVFGGLRAVRSATRLPPAVAMSPAAPPVYHRGWLDRLGGRLRFRQTTMMILRSLVRWPGRAAVTLFGVSGSVAVLVTSFFTFDAIDLILDELFERANRQDATVTLAHPVNARAELDALALPGVMAVEGLYAAPVRLVNGTRSRLVSLQARAPDARLSRLLDADGEALQMPTAGLALAAGLADALAVEPGDRIRVDLLSAPRGTWEIPVSAVIRQSLGQDAYMNRDAFFQLIGEAPQVNMLHLAIDRNRLPELQAKVQETPTIARFTLWSEIRRQFEETLDESLATMTVIFASLGMLITIGVVYNAARIQLAERAYELASLRVLGFRRSEVAYVLMAEQMLLTLAAIPAGWLFGYGFCMLMAEGFSTEVVTIPVVVTRRTYAVATLIVILTALASVLVVRRRLDRIDIVHSLKQKE
ncbi:ABC transporter permease [Jannaschia seohaensis]|uniref:Putative ABC transport system permease protein n=1 Tax=Jannaschia seohaensis TaxID=475081 RepID=A0A2Y9AK55_9RHOB|nr:ABC transporter permease [Jannaschia seohaensis]PWJ20614.1 putative ABC transport system permease protein [Jannaschia seohaensis]SSA44710.1 putative ABC transport system permease protein [Jannaschia seohaensis]